MKRKRNFLIAVLAFLVIGSVAYGASDTFYVTDQGSGTQDGLSYENAWDRTDISWAGGDNTTIDEGDTLYVCDTVEAGISIADSGTEASPIVIRGDYAGHPGIIEASDAIARCIIASGVYEYFTIQSLTLQNPVNNCIRLGGGVDHWTIDDVVCSGSGDNGIYDTSEGNITIKNSEIFDCGNGGAEGGIRIDSNNSLVQNCYIHDNLGDSLDGRGVTTTGENNTVEYNTITGNGGGAAGGGSAVEGLGGAKNNIVRYNYCYNQQNNVEWKQDSGGTQFYQNVFALCGSAENNFELGEWGDDPGVESTGCTVEYNTFYGGSSGDGGHCIEFSSCENTFKNNILIGATETKAAINFKDLESANWGTWDNNLIEGNADSDIAYDEDTTTFYNLAEWQALSGQSTNCAVVTDAAPPVASTDYGDRKYLHPIRGAAYNKGAAPTNSFTDDLNGSKRQRWDVGCYKYVPPQ